MRAQRGFTLVELVMVIVLLSIVATISVQFVALSTRGAIDVGDRQQRALRGVVLSEQITRELRGAFALSLRTNGSCVEWIPVLAATSYRSLPTGTSSTTVEILPFGSVVNAGARLIVYGYGSAQEALYEPGTGSSVPNPGPISPQIEQVDAGDNLITFAGGQSHRFRERSPQKRIYAVGGRVSLCQAAGGKWLYRYRDYVHGTDQPTFAELEAKAGLTREVLSASLVPGSLEWRVTPVSLKRSAVAHFAFELSTPGSGETTPVTQEVHVRNVP